MESNVLTLSKKSWKKYFANKKGLHLKEKTEGNVQANTYALIILASNGMDRF